MAKTHRICSIPDCGKISYLRGWCRMHHSRWKRHGDPLKTLKKGQPRSNFLCTVPNCDEPATARGWCRSHYERWKRYGDPQGVRPPHPPRDICSVDDCGKPVKARGMCSIHYQRWLRNGDASIVRKPRGRVLPFFMDHVGYQGEDCLEWPFASEPSGYGKVWYEKRNWNVHRLMCYLTYGPAPSRSHVAAHNCGNPACFNPNHLRWATPQQNAADKVLHGTAGRGEKNPMARLTEQAVRFNPRSPVSGAAGRSRSALRRHPIANFVDSEPPVVGVGGVTTTHHSNPSHSGHEILSPRHRRQTQWSWPLA